MAININEVRRDYFYKLFKILALNLFEYQGFEDTGIDFEYVEESLMDKGRVVWFKDKKNGEMILQGSGTEDRNVYNKPTAYQVNGVNFQKKVKASESVLIKNNIIGMPLFDILYDYADQIANLRGAQDVNVEVNKMPYMIVGDEKSVTTIQTKVKNIKENKLLIVGTKAGLENPMQVMVTGAKLMLKELQDHKNSLFGEVLTILGIDNLNIDKKERNTVDEVNANNEMIMMFGEAMLASRQKAMKEISEMSGIPRSVRRRAFEEIIETIEEGDPDDDSGLDKTQE